MELFPLFFTLVTACSILSGERNCPFFILITFPVLAAATNKSVCRQRKAGICNTSTYCAAIEASSSECISVKVGMLNFSPTFFSMERASLFPIPVKESILLRFAFR